MIDLDLFFDISRDVAMATVTNLFWAIFDNVEIDRLHFSLSYSETKCPIALIPSRIALDSVKKW